MPYPNQILPCLGHKLIDCSVDHYYLIRHTDIGDPDQIKDPVTGFIKPKYICSPEERIEDLSTSLLGIFEPGFISLEFTATGKASYMHYCEPDITVPVPQAGVDYHHNNGRNAWTLLVSLVNGVVFDYSIANIPYKAICRVVHTPMRWNFWHYSIRWETNNLGRLVDLDEKQKAKVARRIGMSTRALFCKFAKLEIPSHQRLPEGCYKAETAPPIGWSSVFALLI